MKEIITELESLYNRAEEIDITSQGKEMREIIHEIKDTMRKKGLKHLSAPAIGYNKRIFCIDYEDLEIKTYINPLIIESKGLSLSRETSDCIPDKTYLVPRNNDIKVMYQKPIGPAETRQLLGVAAMVFQQEVNMLDGVLLSDIGLEIDEDFDNATDEEKSKIIEMYLDSLDLKAKEAEVEIEKDPELKELNEGIDFMQGLAKGEIKQDL